MRPKLQTVVRRLWSFSANPALITLGGGAAIPVAPTEAAGLVCRLSTAGLSVCLGHAGGLFGG